MHRVLILSDTHGQIRTLEHLIEQVPFDWIIHLGDFVSDAHALKKLYPHIVIEAVRGNNDYTSLPSEKLIELWGQKIFICHGHGYSLSGSFDKLYKVAEHAGATMVFFGHTHCPFDKTIGNIRFFCPGSPSYPRGGEAACGILEIEGGQVGLAHYMFME